LGEALGQMDFETAAKLSGSRFVVLKKGLARMERALGQFMLDLHTDEHGYTEVQPPLLVRDEVPFGTGQLPKSAEDMFATARRLGNEEFAELALSSALNRMEDRDYDPGKYSPEELFATVDLPRPAFDKSPLLRAIFREEWRRLDRERAERLW